MIIAPAVLAGLAAGAAVFVGTLVAVYLLLRGGGSFDRMAREAAGLPTAVGEQKPLLYDELLDKARSLALRPAPLPSPLQGEVVRVREQVDADLDALFRISNGEPRSGVYGDFGFDADELIWRYLPYGPFPSLAAFRDEFASESMDARRLTLCDRSGQFVIGTLALGAHSPRDLRVEIQDLWLAPAFQGSSRTGVLTETVLLVLGYLFDASYRRVEWRCDGHNVRARRAAHSLGLSFEGVLRKHRIVKESNCDSVVFAAINSEWPVLRDHLTMRLRQATSALAEAEAEDKKSR